MPKKRVSRKIEEKKENSHLFHILPAIILIVFLALISYANNFFLAASVNGTPVYKAELTEALMQQSGKEMLDGLISEKLILQEANKKGIKVSDQEINSTIKKIEKNVEAQGQKLDQLLVMQGLTKEKFKNQVKVQKTIEKMFADKITVSDKEIDDFIKANEQFLSANANADSNQVRNSVREQLRQNKLREKTRALIDKLKKSSKIEYFINSK